MKRPNFFIVGAPKCGTTALSEYLRTHPQVFFSNPKETNLFSKDLSLPYRRYHTEDQYLSNCFRGSNETHIAVGEGSTTYFFSQVAFANIKEFNPLARIIVMLRNPVDMAYSYHSQNVFQEREIFLDFKQAWDMQDARMEGMYLPDHCPEPKIFQYSYVCSLATHMERLYANFPPEQVLPILFDDFKSKTEEIYKLVLTFLDLPYDGRSNFPKVRSNRVNSIHCLAKVLMYPPRSYLKIKKLLGINKTGLGIIYKALLNLNSKEVERKPLSREMRAKLVEVFYDEIKKLEIILNKDLKDWTRLD